METELISGTLIQSDQVWWALGLPQGQALETHLTGQESMSRLRGTDWTPGVKARCGAPLSPGLLAASGVPGPWSGQALSWLHYSEEGPHAHWSHLPALSPQQTGNTTQELIDDLDLTWSLHPQLPAGTGGSPLQARDWLRQWLLDARAQLRAGLKIKQRPTTTAAEIGDELLSALALPAHLAMMQEEALANGLERPPLNMSAPVALSILRALACADELARFPEPPVSVIRHRPGLLRLSGRQRNLPPLLTHLSQHVCQWADLAGARNHAEYTASASLWLLSPVWGQRTATWINRRWWALKRSGTPARTDVDEELIHEWMPALGHLPLSQAAHDWRMNVTLTAEVSAERYALQPFTPAAAPGSEVTESTTGLTDGTSIPASMRPPRPWPRAGQSQAEASAEALAMEQAWGQPRTRAWNYSPLNPRDTEAVRAQARGELERRIHGQEDISQIARHWLLNTSAPACFMPPPSELHTMAQHFIRHGGAIAPHALTQLSRLSAQWTEHTCLHGGLDSLAPLAEAEERCARQLYRMSGHQPRTQQRLCSLTPGHHLTASTLWELEEAYARTGAGNPLLN